MESTINALIQFAIDVIAAKPEIKRADKVEGIYESYLSQFGPMVIQLGLRSTLAIYLNKEGSSKGKRFYILDMIWRVLGESHFCDFSTSDVNSYDKWANKFLKQKQEIDSVTEALILDASVALKRAIRTFSMTDDKNE